MTLFGLDLDRMRPWRDRRGRLSPLRIAILGALLVPVGLSAAAALGDGLGPRPVNVLIHNSGYWALVFLIASLAITPLARVGRFSKLLDVRRMIGVGAFVYAAAHLVLYVVDEKGNLLKVASEIVLRFYLTIGLVALLGLLALAATSTDGMIKRLGSERWRRLHQAAYVIAILAIVHFYLQTKSDIALPILFTGLFLWLMLYRLIVKARGAGGMSFPWLAGSVLLVTAGIAFGEALYIAWKFGVSPLLVLESNTDTALGLRPAQGMLIASVIVIALDRFKASRSGGSGDRGTRTPPR